MSDQTPNSTEDLNGSEPSMEDILASIRKIISEDEPVALESPEDPGLADIVSAEISPATNNVLSEFGHAPNDFVSDAVADVQSANLVETLKVDTESLDTGSVDLNIDDVLAGLDDDLLADEAVTLPDVESNALELAKPLAAASGAATATAASFESDDDILAFLDADIPLDDDIDVSDVAADLNGVEDFVLPSSEIDTEFDALEAVSSAEDTEMDALLDDILEAPENQVMDLVPEELDDSLDIADELSLSEEESDLALVKSLMADLADDPEGLEAGDDLDALLEIPELDESEDIIEDMEAFTAAEVDVVSDAQSDISAAEAGTLALDADFADGNTAVEDEDILGDILDMTIEDELGSQPDDIDLDALTNLDNIAAAEQDNILENALGFDEVDLADAETTEVLPSLSEIAAAAEADAVAVETNAMSTPVIGAASAALAGAGFAALGAKVAEPDAETSDAVDVETDPADIDNKIDSFIDKLSADSSADEDTTEISQSLTHQETSMPVKAVKTDTILDEVTEAATAGAFAELNTVVEDKAIFNERGPRIGDLVQEALRPMLKEWLDANLKGIVERAVTKEVKRISSGK